MNPLIYSIDEKTGMIIFPGCMYQATSKTDRAGLLREAIQAVLGTVDALEHELKAITGKDESQEDRSVVITVRGGVVQDVDNLPEGWSYTLKDYDDDPDQDD